MIVKSMARRNKSFEALYEYFTKDKDAKLFAFNLYSSPNDKQRVVNEFLQNARFIKSARGKNFLFHEIISLKKSSLEFLEQEHILLELAKEYLDKRAKEHLVLSAIHKDKEHLHIHLMISANAIGEKKRKRLSKAQFAHIQQKLESFQNEHYPDLYSRHYDKSYSNEQIHKGRNEQEIKAKRHAKTKKQSLKERLLEIFEKADSQKRFEELLADMGMTLYKRGSLIGVEFEGKKYRFNTLGIMQNYQAVQDGFEDMQNETAHRSSAEADDLKADSAETDKANSHEAHKNKNPAFDFRDNQIELESKFELER